VAYYETVDGETVVLCDCYDCEWVLQSQFNGLESHRPQFTLAEYQDHRVERQRSYNEYTIRQAELKSIARPKETEAPGEHGRSPGVTTRFNLHTGQLSSDDDRLLGNVRWETLWRASIE